MARKAKGSWYRYTFGCTDGHGEEGNGFRSFRAKNNKEARQIVAGHRKDLGKAGIPPFDEKLVRGRMITVKIKEFCAERRIKLEVKSSKKKQSMERMTGPGDAVSHAAKGDGR